MSLLDSNFDVDLFKDWPQYFRTIFTSDQWSKERASAISKIYEGIKMCSKQMGPKNRASKNKSYIIFNHRKFTIIGADNQFDAQEHHLTLTDWSQLYANEPYYDGSGRDWHWMNRSGQSARYKHVYNENEIAFELPESIYKQIREITTKLLIGEWDF